MTFSFTTLCRCRSAHAARPLRAGRQRLALTVLAVLTIIAPALLAALPASAQGVPLEPLERPITIVVPAAAGGTTDIVARVLAGPMGKDLGVPVVVENKGGGGGSIGTAQVARAKPDGHTLLMGNIGPVAINFSLYKQLSYKESDLRGITNVISVPNVLVVHADSPVRSVPELLALARTRRLNVATSGVGQSSHMSCEMFRQKTGIEITLVPFSGAAPAVTALLGQQVDFVIDNLPSSMPHIKAGKFRALAITSATRSAQLPEVPTMAEAGVPMQVTAWFGLLAPAGTPDAMIERLQQSARKAMQTPEVLQRWAGLGGVPGGQTPAEYDAFIAQERKHWARIVKAAGLSLE
ncbi:Bug family tripartite tricarboxylate transporter substrate binding protein [Verminephrobacter eiseniae]|uniref:Uncharacterized protein UPF0065 n=1 Tax=Verminephrobacter eiseniae (strain EF01-2) TaxID=391735 RepID=A1WS89_VEREI|nr:tripartite tricarboxylate transporter substrate binding protein [Verminephrobacter eiseniae]ABM60496.1 Uncharacterized protein UPF0065 [Verminephrobacter eiseniae EF01-2]MCW5285972.1 tripartite tricarboxylate transporter substrate binding protein [Verminephrobacter eiseniae]MCW5304270.1 tripartite tricarboxylate transporter substrate binding protein [Verminephrobacter eiseniae]MCW8180785.1 tripartite tricarboxylate transporter substrate binding protein [Verminephrobacter eiseniae]MCW8191764